MSILKPELKRKIRKLKQFENTVKAQNNIDPGASSVWDKFFDLRETGKSTAMYSLTALTKMTKNEYKSVIDEYFARVYYEIYIHKGIINAPVYDPELLKQLDLPPIADRETVKKRFRDLAKKHHPDKGGNPENFIKLMNIYQELSVQ